MEKKFFQISLFLAILLFVSMTACGLLIVTGTVINAFNLKEIGAGCLYGWLFFFGLSLLFGALHVFKDCQIPTRY